MTGPWTAEYLGFVLPLTAEQVLRPARQHMLGATPASRLEWRWIQTAQRPTEQYGAAGALARLNSYPVQPTRQIAA